jgi:hypothetical protein
MAWIRDSGVPRALLSDTARHLHNKVVEQLQLETARARHEHGTATAYHTRRGRTGRASVRGEPPCVSYARLTVAAHGGLAAHQGMTPTLEELARVFYLVARDGWMRDWVGPPLRNVGRCVHCRTSDDVARTKRAFHASVTASWRRAEQN